MRTFEEIYILLTATNEGDKFSLRELLTIFENENSWIGSAYQMMKLKEYQQEITGIRPGNCSGCNIEVMVNMIRWVNRYEQENVNTQVETKQRAGRPRKN